VVITRGIREFMGRDWRAVRGAKDRYLAERIDRCGPLAALRIAEERRQQACQLDTTWPDAQAGPLVRAGSAADGRVLADEGGCRLGLRGTRMLLGDVRGQPECRKVLATVPAKGLARRNVNALHAPPA